MPKEARGKSSHLQDMEEKFAKRTRRFSPFSVLGLSGDGGIGDETPVDNDAQLADQAETPALNRGVDETHIGVESTHVDTTPGGGTHPHVGGIHTRVVERSRSAEVTTTRGWNPHTHMYVDSTHTPSEESIEAFSGDRLLDQPAGQPQIALWQSDEQVQDIAAAMVLRNQLTEKARQVLSYLNNSRALDQPSYTVPIGYAQISREADLSEHYLRREVLPKLAMLGLIAVAHKSFQGTTYHLHHTVQFLRLIASKDSDFGIPTRPAHLPSQQTLPLSGGETVLPSWIDREHWGWLPAESVQLLVAKAGTESQAKEKLDIIIYNESHGSEDRRVRDRRAVLSHYLRTPQADIWPNDNGYESRSLRLAREERDRALQEKALTEEALHIRQEAAKARFLANLEDSQLVWLKQEAKRRVDARPESRILSSRYPLYKAEEEEVVLEWMDRVSYGEEIPTAGERTAE